MKDSEKLLCFQMAKEMTIAKLGSSAAPVNDSTGRAAADMFEVIFKQLCELIDQTPSAE